MTPTSRIITRCTQDIQAGKKLAASKRLSNLYSISRWPNLVVFQKSSRDDSLNASQVRSSCDYRPGFHITRDIGRNPRGMVRTDLHARSTCCQTGNEQCPRPGRCTFRSSNERTRSVLSFPQASGTDITRKVSLRAYGAQTAFKLESYKRIDAYSLPARTFFGLNR